MDEFLSIMGRMAGMLSIPLLGFGFYSLIRQTRKSSKLTVGSHAMSIFFSLCMLAVNLIFLREAQVNWVAGLVLALGAGFGYAWSWTTKMRLEDRAVVGKRSILYLVFWICSLAVTQALAAFAKADAVFFGLCGMFFSTGASLGTNGNIIFRIYQLRGSSIPSLAKPVEEPLQADVSEKVECPVCGKLTSADKPFCTQCGSKLNENATDLSAEKKQGKSINQKRAKA